MYSVSPITSPASRSLFPGSTLKPSSSHQRSGLVSRAVSTMQRLETLVANNRKWIEESLKQDPEFFSKWATSQSPEFIWIGCADSRVVPNSLLGLRPGDVFGHRNVGNVVNHSDGNVMSVLEYGIGALKAKHVIVCGHYGCGAVKASLTLPAKSDGVVNGWITNIRNVRNKYATQLASLPSDQRPDLLSELNALEQMISVCTSAPVQKAWAGREDVVVSCVVYDVATGALKILVPAVSSLDQLVNLAEFKDGIAKTTPGIKEAFTESVKGLVKISEDAQ